MCMRCDMNFAGCTTAWPSSSSWRRRASGWPSSTSATPSTARSALDDMYYVVLFSRTATPDWLSISKVKAFCWNAGYVPASLRNEAISHPLSSSLLQIWLYPRPLLREREAVCKAKWWMAPPPSHFLVAGPPAQGLARRPINCTICSFWYKTF